MLWTFLGGELEMYLFDEGKENIIYVCSVLGPWTLKRCCGWSECFSQAVGYIWGPPQRQTLCLWKVNWSKQNF